MAALSKILHVTSSYYPNQDGVSKVVQIYSSFFACKGIESWVLTTGTTGNLQEINGVRVGNVNISGNDVKGIRGDIQEFHNFLLENNFDIIITYAAQTWHFDLLSRLPSEVRKKTKLVCFTVGFSGLIGVRKIWYYRYYQNMPKRLSNFDLIITHSQKYIDYDYVTNLYTNIKVLPNGFDKSEFNLTVDNIAFRQELKELYNIPTNKKIILNVSNHVYAKGHIDFIRLSKHFKDYVFINVGNPTTRFMNCSERCHNESIKFDGINNNYISLKMQRGDLIKLFKVSYLFLLTSNTEAFPLVILEALASNLPFISYNVGNVCEMPGGIVARNYRDIISIISHMDSKKYTSLQTSIQNNISKYEWTGILDLYMSYLEELLNG